MHPPTQIPIKTPLPDPIMLEGSGDSITKFKQKRWASGCSCPVDNASGQYFGMMSIDRKAKWYASCIDGKKTGDPMKYQDYFQNKTTTISPELKAAYDNYRLAFFRRAVRDLDAKVDKDILTAKGDKQQNETTHRPF